MNYILGFQPRKLPIIHLGAPIIGCTISNSECVEQIARLQKFLLVDEVTIYPIVVGSNSYNEFFMENSTI